MAVLRVPDDLHVLTSPVTLGLGGTGGGPSTGGQVQIVGVHCSKCDVWGVASCVMYLAMISARTKANPLVRLEFLGGSHSTGATVRVTPQVRHGWVAGI